MVEFVAAIALEVLFEAEQLHSMYNPGEENCADEFSIKALLHKCIYRVPTSWPDKY